LGASDDRSFVFGIRGGAQLDFDPRQLPTMQPDGFAIISFTPMASKRMLDFYAAHAFTVERVPRHSLLP